MPEHFGGVAAERETATCEHIWGYKRNLEATLYIWHSFPHCMWHQLRDQSAAAAADGGPQTAAEHPKEAAGEEVWSRSPQEHQTAAGKERQIKHSFI